MALIIGIIYITAGTDLLDKYKPKTETITNPKEEKKLVRKKRVYDKKNSEKIPQKPIEIIDIKWDVVSSVKNNKSKEWIEIKGEFKNVSKLRMVLNQFKLQAIDNKKNKFSNKLFFSVGDPHNVLDQPVNVGPNHHIFLLAKIPKLKMPIRFKIIFPAYFDMPKLEIQLKKTMSITYTKGKLTSEFLDKPSFQFIDF